MEREIELLLDKCIAEMSKGKNIEECVAQFPKYADQLKPLLELARQIEALPYPKPSPEAVSTTLINIGREISKDTAGREVSVAFSKFLKKTPMLNVFRWQKLAWVGAALFVVVLFSAATISSDSIPGDILYPLKLATEKVKFSLTFDSEKKAELRLTFSDKRLQEMLAVFQESDTLNITLLKSMLDEAKLALEEYEVPPDKAFIVAAKLNYINAYQKDVLEKIRPHINLSNRQIVDEAVNVCDMRGRWMRSMMNDEIEASPDSLEPDSTESQRMLDRPKQKSNRRQWGPGCDWMR